MKKPTEPSTWCSAGRVLVCGLKFCVGFSERGPARPSFVYAVYQPKAPQEAHPLACHRDWLLPHTNAHG